VSASPLFFLNIKDKEKVLLYRPLGWVFKKLLTIKISVGAHYPKRKKGFLSQLLYNLHLNVYAIDVENATLFSTH